MSEATTTQQRTQPGTASSPAALGRHPDELAGRQAGTRPPRVLYVITRAVIGGAQSHLQQLLACPAWGERALVVGAPGPCTEFAQRLGIQVWLVPSLVNTINPYLDLRAVRELVGAIDRFQPDVVHAHSSKAGTIARLAAHRCGVPAVFTVHGWAFSQGMPPLRRCLAMTVERAMARYAHRIVCVSDSDYQLARRCRVGRPGQVLRIWNGLPDVPQRCSYQPHDPVRAIMVARFAHPKDHQVLFRAVARLRQPLEMVLVGGGERLREAQALGERLGIADRLRFLGDCHNVPHLLADADLFVLTSRSEGFPVSILEAMRAGLPVIASDVGGIREQVVEGATGYLVPGGDDRLLAARLEHLLAHPELRRQLGEAGRRRYLEDFTLDKMISATLDVYLQVTGNHRPAAL